MRLALCSLSCLALAACLSTGAAPPPVRVFDPLPAAPADRERQADVRVDAGPAIRAEFVLRTAERELVVDDQHRWFAPPEQLIAAALQRGLALGESAPAALHVHLQRFELDLTEAPAAVVEWRYRAASASAADRSTWRECRGRAAATSRDPADLASAMARAIEQAVGEMQAALQ